MRFIGADLHKKSITFCVVETDGHQIRVVKRQRIMCCEVERIEKFIESHTPCQLTVEATIGYEWFASLAAESAQRVVLAHAGKLRIIAESTRKTDKIDAYVLAEFLARDMIPAAWQPTARVRQHRALVRRRGKVQSRITSVKNTLRAILTRYNQDLSNLFTVLGREKADEIKKTLLDEDRWVLDDLFEELQEQTDRLKRVDRRLAEFSKSASVKEREAREVLASMPGIGVVTVDTILAELGDWTRFRKADAVISYAGLDPGVRESDGHRKDLKISKAGSPLLRWIMIQLAHRMKRTTVRWGRMFEQISRRAGKKKATVAVARRLLLVIFAMLRDGRSYQMAA